MMGWLILTPLAGAALAFLWPRQAHRLGLAVAGVVMWAVVGLWRQVTVEGVLRHKVGGWGAPLGIELRADGLSLLMLVVAGAVGVAVTLYARGYFAGGHGGGGAESDRRADYFWSLWLFLWAALNTLFLTADIFTLYVSLELTGFAAVALAALAGGKDALRAAMRYLAVSLTGSLLYLLGVALVYGQYATVDMALLADRAQPGVVTQVALAVMTVGLLMKGAVFPLHFWLPPAHANAPAPVSALLSALVVKGAYVILLRLWFESFAVCATLPVMQWCGVLGAGAVLWGALQALVQGRLKLVVAYSTVAQLGYMFLLFPLASVPGAGFAGWSGGLMLLAAHACAKTAMFLTAGNIMYAAGHDRVRDLDGLAHALPVSAFAFALSGISLVGLPPSGGFAGKWLLLNAALAQGQWWWVAVLLAGTLLAAAYVVRVLERWFKQTGGSSRLRAVPAVMEWTALGMALLAVLLGFVAGVPVDWLRLGAPVSGPVLFGGGML
jgi:formate hydrogenlyase subunit 3/multisubunit Na+/H+ antiporter MnhD subunit